MADGGIDMVNLKRMGRWSSDKCVEGYLANSSSLKRSRMMAIERTISPPTKKGNEQACEKEASDGETEFEWDLNQKKNSVVESESDYDSDETLEDLKTQKTKNSKQPKNCKRRQQQQDSPAKTERPCTPPDHGKKRVGKTDATAKDDDSAETFEFVPNEVISLLEDDEYVLPLIKSNSLPDDKKKTGVVRKLSLTPDQSTSLKRLAETATSIAGASEQDSSATTTTTINNYFFVMDPPKKA